MTELNNVEVLCKILASIVKGSMEKLLHLQSDVYKAFGVRIGNIIL